MTRRNVVVDIPYKDAEGPDDNFEVYETDEGWFWEFSPVWRAAGPFETMQEAITAGELFLDEKGEPYIK